MDQQTLNKINDLVSHRKKLVRDLEVLTGPSLNGGLVVLLDGSPLSVTGIAGSVVRPVVVKHVWNALRESNRELKALGFEPNPVPEGMRERVITYALEHMA